MDLLERVQQIFALQLERDAHPVGALLHFLDRLAHDKDLALRVHHASIHALRLLGVHLADAADDVLDGLRAFLEAVHLLFDRAGHVVEAVDGFVAHFCRKHAVRFQLFGD